MHANIQTVAFRGIDTIAVDVQIHIANGLPTMAIDGLADKSVAESKERVRAALTSIGLSLPPKRIAINLAPADVLKEGAHFDLPIALGLLVAMGVVPADAVADRVVLGKLSLNGAIQPVSGALSAAIFASSRQQNLICPAASGSEAAWAGDVDVLALLNHVRGSQILNPPTAKIATSQVQHPDMADLRGQLTARRVLEIAATGGHNLLLIGPPGAGKSMLAARLPGLLPPLTPEQALQVTMFHSIAGQLSEGGLIRDRPFREPHHSASMAALVGGGMRAKPGEISLAHHGVLFLDELAEFSRVVLDSLRQPLETGKVVVVRANNNYTYPAQFQLVAAMNPCRCGYLGDPARACSRAPECGRQYCAKVSGPVMDRFDLIIEVPEVTPDMLMADNAAESSADIFDSIMTARSVAMARASQADGTLNAKLAGDDLDSAIKLENAARDLLKAALEQQQLSARAYHKIMRVARTIADLDDNSEVTRAHLAEALAYRAMPLFA